MAKRQGLKARWCWVQFKTSSLCVGYLGFGFFTWNGCKSAYQALTVYSLPLFSGLGTHPQPGAEWKCKYTSVASHLHTSHLPLAGPSCGWAPHRHLLSQTLKQLDKFVSNLLRGSKIGMGRAAEPVCSKSENAELLFLHSQWICFQFSSNQLSKQVRVPATGEAAEQSQWYSSKPAIGK